MAPDSVLLVTTAEDGMRDYSPRELEVEKLSVNVNLFLQQMQVILQKAPEKMGRFHFAEFEVHADISASGQLILMGTGGQAGISGGVKFIFKRSMASEAESKGQ